MFVIGVGVVCMAGLGSKALQSRRARERGGGGVVVEVGQMGEGDLPFRRGGDKRGKNRKNRMERGGKHRDVHKEKPRKISNGAIDQKVLKQQNAELKTTVLRKKVDPETAKYFSQISNLFESGGIDLEERPVICANALEEAGGKELELSTDKILSRTLQHLLEGCDVNHLCAFLHNCTNDFQTIATDKSGSHVAETALKSLSVHLGDDEAYSMIENALTKICQIVVECSAVLMCSSYGSHVLRSLLCLCKGVPLDSVEQYHRTSSSSTLAERLNSGLLQEEEDRTGESQESFPHLLKFLIREMLNKVDDVSSLPLNQSGSLILQVALKLLAGENQELLYVIPILLGCKREDVREDDYIGTADVQKILDFLKDASYSHLMEVILEVSPEALYNEILTKIFSGSLYDISSNDCGSFVVQALISSARGGNQIELICQELGSKIRDLLELGKSGVVATMLAACQRLHKYENECCQSLSEALRSPSETSKCIVPRILFLDNYFCCQAKSSWQWAVGDKMHTLGCLMLQTLFKYPIQYIRPYVESIVHMEMEHVFDIAKDAGGRRVIEAFLSSDASSKQKRKIIAKLEGHFGELSLNTSASFTVEKCFTASNVVEKETILSELVAVRDELSKTKHGPVLMKKLDVEGFSKRPDLWRSRQASKQVAYKEFASIFGTGEKSKKENFLSTSSHDSKKLIRQMRKEINQSLGPWSRDKGKRRVGQKSYSERNSVAEHRGKKGPWSKKELSFVSSNNAQNRSDRFISSKAACANNVAATNANRSKKRRKESNDFPAASSKRKNHGV